MQQSQFSTHRHTPIQSGVDWITATAKAGSASLDLEKLADEVLEQKRDAGRDVKPASRLSYRGYETDHFFFGRRTEDSAVIVSSHEAGRLARSIIDIATNVSRLDLQVTVWTHGEQCNLAVENYRKLVASRRQAHRPGQISLTTSYPQGDTLNVNKRSSDTYGRLYDKAAEAKAAPPHTIWRYEVEYKRRAAMAVASAYAHATSGPDFTRDRIHSFWRSKGVEPTFEPSKGARLEPLSIDSPERDVLTWFETSLSITVARAIKRHGLKATLDALGLSALVAPHTERR